MAKLGTLKHEHKQTVTKYGFAVDEGLETLIELINDSGYLQTLHSCIGLGRTVGGYVMVRSEDISQLTGFAARLFVKLPPKEGWSLDLCYGPLTKGGLAPHLCIRWGPSRRLILRVTQAIRGAL